MILGLPPSRQVVAALDPGRYTRSFRSFSLSLAFRQSLPEWRFGDRFITPNPVTVNTVTDRFEEWKNEARKTHEGTVCMGRR